MRVLVKVSTDDLRLAEAENEAEAEVEVSDSPTSEFETLTSRTTPKLPLPDHSVSSDMVKSGNETVEKYSPSIFTT